MRVPIAVQNRQFLSGISGKLILNCKLSSRKKIKKWREIECGKERRKENFLNQLWFYRSCKPIFFWLTHEMFLTIESQTISVHITCCLRSDVVFPLGLLTLCSLSKNLTDLALTHGVTSRVGTQGLLQMNMAWRCLLFLSPAFFIIVLFILERRLLESFSSHERQVWRVSLFTLSSK